MRFFFALFILLLATPASAQEAAPSVFFTPEEAAHLGTNGKGEALNEEPAHLIHFDSLLYLGPGKWTAWFNGQKVTPGHNAARLTIVSVSADAAQVTYEGTSTPVLLRPHQSLNLMTGEVSEGK